MWYVLTQWKLGETVSIDPDLRAPILCSNGVLHAYPTFWHSLLFRYDNGGHWDDLPFEADGDVAVATHTKVGCYELTITREFAPPEWASDMNYVHMFARLVGLELWKDLSTDEIPEAKLSGIYERQREVIFKGLADQREANPTISTRSLRGLFDEVRDPSTKMQFMGAAILAVAELYDRNLMPLIEKAVEEVEEKYREAH